MMAAISIGVNIILGATLMWPMKHGGLALATSLASILNLVLLIRALKKKVGLLKWVPVLKSIIKSLCCAVVMGIVVMVTARLMLPAGAATFQQLFMGVILSVVLGVGTYAGCAFLVKCPETHELILILKSRRVLDGEHSS